MDKDATTGQFLPGNKAGLGRAKGSRNKMTQRMLDRVASRSEDGLSMEEILMDIAQDPRQPAELRFKAASKIADLVFPKASSVEVKMDDDSKMNKEQIDMELKRLLSGFIKVDQASVEEDSSSTDSEPE